MTENQIKDAIYQHYPANDILSLKTITNKYNGQPEEIKIIFRGDYTKTSEDISNFMDTMNHLVADDGYGDITEFSVSWTSYEKVGKGYHGSLTFTFSIDS